MPFLRVCAAFSATDRHAAQRKNPSLPSAEGSRACGAAAGVFDRWPAPLHPPSPVTRGQGDDALRARLHAFSNRKKIQRLWREEGLKVPHRKRKRQRLGTSTCPADRLRAERPNHVWARLPVRPDLGRKS
jgi:hypothetical protein